jgi:anti-anti-sigma factor
MRRCLTAEFHIVDTGAGLRIERPTLIEYRSALDPGRVIRVSDTPQAFAVGIVKDGPVVRVVVTGDLDLATANELVAQARPAFGDTTVTDVALDVSGVGFCDSAGISALIQLRKLATESGQELRVTDAQPAVVRVIEYSGVREYLNLE